MEEKRKMKLTFKEVRYGNYEVYNGDKLVAQMLRHNIKRMSTSPWEILTPDNVHIAVNGFDYFKFGEAKQRIQEMLGVNEC
jgi:hypothetical protein